MAILCSVSGHTSKKGAGRSAAPTVGVREDRGREEEDGGKAEKD